jgi:hypothetical protein
LLVVELPVVLEPLLMVLEADLLVVMLLLLVVVLPVVMEPLLVVLEAALQVVVVVLLVTGRLDRRTNRGPGDRERNCTVSLPDGLIHKALRIGQNFRDIHIEVGL